jgi:pyridoxine 5-phosphate synthase
MMAKLAVNVDHVATIRQARRVDEPDPVLAAAIAELAGAEGIIIHLREDRRHIQDRDLEILRKTVKTQLNLEMAATDEMVGIAMDVKPDVVTFVPEKRAELTTEGGLDVLFNKEKLKEMIEELKQVGIKMSLFIDPDLEQVKASHRLGANAVEMHTGSYCDSRLVQEIDKEFNRIEDAVMLSSKLGLEVRAGHGLDYRNIQRILTLKDIEEYSIGHSIIARTVIVGMERAVREMVELIKAG